MIVYIEEYNHIEKNVIFDFYDSNEFNLFSETSNLFSKAENPTMIQLINYQGRRVRENTYYSIRKEIVLQWIEDEAIQENSQNSFLIGYIINNYKIKDEVFSSSVQFNDYLDFEHNAIIYGSANINQYDFNLGFNSFVNVRNVGQGNWNEIYSNRNVKVVFDIGASMNCSRERVLQIIADKPQEYYNTRPILVLSHWDKDHYHSLLAFSDYELDYFSAYIIKSRLPNLTSRKIMARIVSSVGTNRILSLDSPDRFSRNVEPKFRALNDIRHNIVIFNAEKHKNRNISGIIILVKKLHTSIVLSGDAHYSQIQSDILPSIVAHRKHHLVVPHHGGNAGRYSYSARNLIKDTAVISVGRNTWKHPKDYYVDNLRIDFNSLQRTDYVGRDIRIELN